MVASIMSDSMRFGELLVQARLITEAQLQKALETQTKAGGRLGTALLEIGALDLDKLATELGKQRGIPAALQKHFQGIQLHVVKLVPAVEITSLRYQAFTPAHRREVRSSPREIAAGTQRREGVAVYDDRTKTVFLPDTWTGATPADLSVLVHEMVHHLQNSAHMKYECPGAR